MKLILDNQFIYKRHNFKVKQPLILTYNTALTKCAAKRVCSSGWMDIQNDVMEADRKTATTNVHLHSTGARLQTSHWSG